MDLTVERALIRKCFLVKGSHLTEERELELAQKLKDTKPLYKKFFVLFNNSEVLDNTLKQMVASINGVSPDDENFQEVMEYLKT